MKYAIVSFGCRVNQADSSDIERQLRAQGGRRTTPEEADVVVVNTCSVTAAADQGARQVIRRIGRSNPRARIVATGCYATRAPHDLSSLPGVALVVSNSDKEAFVDQLGLRGEAPRRTEVGGVPADQGATREHINADPGPTTAHRFGGGTGACGAPADTRGPERTTGLLRVQTGCDEVCAYCIIPTTRGAGRSMPLPQVLAQADRMVREGYQEVAVTGVHVGSYGRDFSPPLTLADLLRSLDAHPSSMVFRLSSLEPMDCTDEVVDVVAHSTRFAPHLHLPLQSGSDRVLRAMRRPYTVAQHDRLVRAVRERLPHAGIGSDVVVGFPGESDEDVDATLAYLAGSPLTYLHVFPYSDRPGTEASTMSNKVPGDVIRARSRAVRACGSVLAARFRAANLGTVRPALTIDGGRLALTDNYLKVRISRTVPENRRVLVRITDDNERPVGELVPSSERIT